MILAATDIIVIGASAGGVESLRQIAAGLPVNLRASIFVVVHVPAAHESKLSQVLMHAGPLPAAAVGAAEPITPGRIYVAPPDRHLNVAGGYVFSRMGPKENGHRPSVDPLFRSAARAYGPRVVGILLSGSDDDGAEGLRSIRHHGGKTFVQDPAETLFAEMAVAGLQAEVVDGVVPLREIPALLSRLASGDPPEETGTPHQSEEESMERGGELSPFTCPDCGGTLWEIEDDEIVRYECHVGHRYTKEGMQSAHDRIVENALWTAVRILQERVELSRRTAARLQRKGLGALAEAAARRGYEAEESALLIRRRLLRDESETISPPASGGEKPRNEPAAD